ncbi:MAG: hypothetical protein M3Q50_08485 [Chloroflexota bacterium]|nr:hypothetical protein [Chloroflexota bacterium]
MRVLIALACCLLLMVSLLAAAPPVAAQDDDALLALLLEQAQARPSIAGPLQGELPIEIGAVNLSLADVTTRDFYAHATFTNPYPAETHLFDIGISFRRTGGDEAFRLIVDSAGGWFFKEGINPEIATGQVEGLRTGAEETNQLDLVAVGNQGYFALNGQYVATLDLTARGIAGDVGVGTGYYEEDQLDGESTPFADFEVWSLDLSSPEVASAVSEADAVVMAELMDLARSGASVSGPLAGEIPMETGTVNPISAGVRLRDFLAHAQFTNPYPTDEKAWDIGFGFRDGGDAELRLSISSDGEWFLSRGPRFILGSGPVTPLDTSAGGSNEVDLVGLGDIGYLAVNGDYVATLDLAASPSLGDIWASAGFHQDNKRDGAMTPYADFEVWSLQGANDQITGDVAAGEVEARAADAIFDIIELGGSAVVGQVTMTANGAQTEFEIDVLETTGGEELGLYTGTCADLAPTPEVALNPIAEDTLISAITLDIEFEALTDGNHAIAIVDGEAPAVVACSDIPAQ